MKIIRKPMSFDQVNDAQDFRCDEFTYKCKGFSTGE